ncbi:hypothetical protein [Pseudomonas sp.]|uniref:hypothetical protein n=1 Tax=Pseudomonas sp. TaxID=306 RepID=UPI001A0E8414|nr:hypothetical protein [Pseudomonas sp.]MBF0675587.1 hypothetical protein [Pseudomonas sp.]
MIERSNFGPYGIAVAKNERVNGYTAWACIGDTIAANALDEPASDVWFSFGETPAVALEKLKGELRQMLS